MPYLSSMTKVFVARRRRLSGFAIVSALAVAACAAPAGPPSTTPSGSPIRIGAVFPIDGNASGLANQELAGVRMAADFVNADGGIGGRPIVLDVRDLESRLMLRQSWRSFERMASRCHRGLLVRSVDRGQRGCRQTLGSSTGRRARSPIG